MNEASSPEELVELVELCRAGKLFDVQKWVAQGKSVTPAGPAKGKGATRNPLRIAMEKGFHSMVQVLLEAGAPWRAGNYKALDDAVEMRRPDLATLLIQHGAQVADISMAYVLEMWHPEMVELFLANGASLVRGNPVACALIYKMRPALGLLKRFADDPAVMKQGAAALRYHAGEGNTKWVSLLLWAGADPWARGPYRLEQLDEEDCDDGEADDEEGLSAFEWAAFRGKIDVLGQRGMLKAMAANPSSAAKLIADACHASDCTVLSWLLKRGYRADALADRGSDAINSLLGSMSWEYPVVSSPTWLSSPSAGGLDSSHARERMKMLHMLVAHGAQWLPVDKNTIGHARRNLLKMAPKYLLEFAWLMRRYRAARRADVEELMRTPSVARLLGPDRGKLNQIVAGIPDAPSAGVGLETGKSSS